MLVARRRPRLDARINDLARRIQEALPLNHGARIDEHVMILPGCIIGHDSMIAAYAALAAGAVVSGGVRVGRRAYLGAASVVRDDVSIGDRSLRGLGAAVVRNMPADVLWAGNSARPVRSKANRT